ncbi:MAG TPA: hypothetical protein VFU19_14450 [Iamia sp.]|nr:hypothetical protein [Iamia sp.]
MPTTAEVEARLRRTAEACAPLVEELLGDEPPAATRAPRRVGWLVAAGLVVAGAAAALVLVDTGPDRPGGEVRATTPTTRDDHTPTTAPAAAHPTLATPVSLADGTEVVLAIPGPERWSARWAEVIVEIDDAGPVEIDLTEGATAVSDPVVEERISDRAVIATWGGRRVLAVAVDGWTASAHLASDGGDLPDDLVPDLARDLTFTVGPGGPVGVTAPGLEVTEVRTLLTRERDVDGREATLTVARVPGGPHPTCVGDPPVAPSSRTQRCVADGQVLLSARGATTQTVLPGIEGRIGAAEPAAGTTLPVSFPDGTQAVVTVPGDGPWPIAHASALVTLDDLPGEDPFLRVLFRPETAFETAVRLGATMEGAGDFVWLARTPVGARTLLVQEHGWTAAVELDGDTVVPDGLVPWLARTIEMEDATAAGPGRLEADGLVVVEAQVELGEPGDPGRPETRDTITLVPGAGCDGAPGRCVTDDLAARATGPTARAVLDGITAEVVRPG